MPVSSTAANGYPLPPASIGIFLREPLSGTMTATELSLLRKPVVYPAAAGFSGVLGISQEANVNAPVNNPLSGQPGTCLKVWVRGIAGSAPVKSSAGFRTPTKTWAPMASATRSIAMATSVNSPTARTTVTSRWTMSTPFWRATGRRIQPEPDTIPVSLPAPVCCRLRRTCRRLAARHSPARRKKFGLAACLSRTSATAATLVVNHPCDQLRSGDERCPGPSQGRADCRC